MTALFEATLKISIIVFAALVFTALLRHRSAALRHWVLAIALACAAAAPLLALIIPPWHVGVGSTWTDRPVDERLGEVQVSRPEPVSSAPPRVSAAPPAEPSQTAGRVAVGTLLVVTWAAGLGVSLVILTAGGLRLARVASRSRRVVDGAWIDIADHIAHTLRLRRPVVLLESDHPRWLITWGLLRPKVILPASARQWPEDRVRLVLYHELAHVRRADWIVQLAAELLRSVQWFNPLVWMACAVLRRESEQACDDAVLEHGADGSEYAAHLVEIARDLRQPRIWTPAPAIARTSSLERRIRAMLNQRLNRRPVSRSARVTTLAATLAVTAAIAALAASQTFSTLAGSIVDPTNAAMPAVTLTLTNVDSQAKYEVQSDRTGRYEFVGLPSGEYAFEARVPGFRSIHSKVIVAGQNLQHDLTLQVGSLQETVTVVGGPSDSGVPTPIDAVEQRLIDARRLTRAAARCPDTPSANVLRIGGNIRQPMKVRSVQPSYPASLRGTGLAGSVVLQARIGPEGNIDDLNVVSSTHDDFTAAASEAVRQWQFDPTLLNCVAIDVDMTVTVNFRYQP